MFKVWNVWFFLSGFIFFFFYIWFYLYREIFLKFDEDFGRYIYFYKILIVVVDILMYLEIGVNRFID